MYIYIYIYIYKLEARLVDIDRAVVAYSKPKVLVPEDA